MPPRTTWTRLEPYARSASFEGGLDAAIHDPLWLLARQWQLREFQGEDAGSPVHARLRMTCRPVSHYHPGAVPRKEDGSLETNMPEQSELLGKIPLETCLEREPVRIQRTSDQPRLAVEGALQPRLSAEAGLYFCRLLSRYDAGAYRSFIRDNFPLQGPAEPLDPDTRRFLQVTAGRVPDGELLYYMLRPNAAGLTGLEDPYRKRVTDGVDAWGGWYEPLAASEKEKVDKAVGVWLEWYRELFSEPPPSGNPSWLPQRMEYAAMVAAPAPGGELVLAAPEYTEGHLDWYAFNTLPGASLGATPHDPADDEKILRSAIPVPVTFRGMPASRYWEFEDARIDFGAVTAGPQQLARLLLIEFGLVAGDDWFLIPVVAPVGSLCYVDSLVVSDTFGERTLLSSARAMDARPLTVSEDNLPWDIFALSSDRRIVEDRPVPDVLFLPPALGTSLHGAPIEELVFLRDEMANMAWAVERTVESLLGRPINRSEAFFRARKGEGPRSEGLPVYRLATHVPDHWVPLLPTPIPGSTAMWLERRIMGENRIQGRILEPDRKEPLFIYEEEVPREGARVSRAFQYTRWIDGNTYLWIGRRKGVGRGEGSSGLQFDVLDPPQKAVP